MILAQIPSIYLIMPFPIEKNLFIYFLTVNLRSVQKYLLIPVSVFTAI